MKTVREMVETFQCPGCAHGENTQCGMFKVHELAQHTSLDDGEKMVTPFRCRNHETTVNMGGYVNVGLPVPMARVQPRDGREEVRTNIRMNLYPVDHSKYWDHFNVPVWAMEKLGFLFVRTYQPRTDQSYVDIIQGGTVDMVRENFPNVIDVTPLADRMQL